MSDESVTPGGFLVQGGRFFVEKFIYFEFCVQYLKVGAMYLNFGATYLNFGATYFGDIFFNLWVYIPTFLQQTKLIDGQTRPSVQ